MDGSKGDSPGADQNRSPNRRAATGGGDVGVSAAAGVEQRRPFTSLSQEESDLALARVLQEQERAYMMLSVHGGGGGGGGQDGGGYYNYYYDDDDVEEGGSYDEDEDEDEDEEDEWVPLDEDDEEYAQALQDHEEREVADRLSAVAGIRDLGQEEMEHDNDDDDDDDDDDHEENGDTTQDAWEDVDPDQYSYEELIALGEVVGTESKGLSSDTLSSLPSITYQALDQQDSNMEQCVICRVEFEDGESLVALPCKHAYHSDCINQWLELNKICPMCSAEVSTSDDRKA